MKILILITTYNRLPYLKQLIDSLVKFQTKTNRYTIVINDDGSTDGTQEYVKSLKSIPNIKYKLNFSYHKNGHHANNALTLYGQHLYYDFGFNMDDDLTILKKGWEQIYIDYANETGFKHLVFHDFKWSSPAQITPSTCQGAFFTFTKDVIQRVGYIDEASFGRRGFGHGDWTARACRFGFNDESSLHDAPNSNEYIKLQSRNGYILTPNYDEELKKAIVNSKQKASLIRDPKRKQVKLQKCFLNYFFDNVYVLNMESRPERRKRMQSLMTNYGISFEFWKAVDGNKIDVDKSKTGNLPNGAIGCALSHIEILEDIKSKGYKRPLILEDDLFIISNISLYAHILYNADLNDFDLLYLGASKWGFDAIKEPHGLKSGKNIDGTFAYCVNGFKIDEIIECAKSNTSTPIDTRLHKIHKKGKSYFVHPMYFIADVTTSDIRKGRRMKEQSKLVGWNLNLYNT